MNRSRTIALFSSSLLLASCLAPQTYFSDVFDLAYGAYQPVLNDQGMIAVNYQIELDIEKSGQSYHYSAALFETGFSVTKNRPAYVGEQLTRVEVTTLFDYAENGVFETSFAENEPETVTQAYAPLTLNHMDRYTSAAESILDVLNVTTLDLIHSKVADFAIGGQPTTNEVYRYEIPIADFVDIAQFKNLLEFVPTSLDVVLTYHKSTQETILDVRGSSETQSYLAKLVLSNPGGVHPSDYQLSPAQRLAFDGYLS